MDPIRFIVKRIIPRYIRLMSASSRVYYAKKSSTYLTLTYYENKRGSDVNKSKRATIKAIDNQISLIKKVKVEILLFQRNRARIEAFLGKYGGKDLVQYIEFHNQTLSKIYRVINKGVYLLALEKKNLKNNRVDLFVQNFKQELRMYAVINQILDQNFEVIENLLAYEYRNKELIPQEIKAASGIGAEISKLKKTKRLFPPLFRAMASSVLFLMMVILAEPGKVYDNMIEKASAKPSIAQLVKKYPKAKDLGEMNRMNQEVDRDIQQIGAEIIRTQQASDMSDEEKAEHVAFLRGTLEDLKFMKDSISVFAEICDEMKKLEPQIERDLAEADALLGSVDAKMADLEAKWQKFIKSEKKAEESGEHNFEDILNE